MKRILLTLLLIAVPVMGAYLAFKTLPYFYYDKLIHGQLSLQHYKLSRWDEAFLPPGEKRGSGEAASDMSSLWREFHLRDVVVPLPAGHPLYRTVPIIQRLEGRAEPQIGMRLLSPSGREVVQLYLLKSGTWSDQLETQPVFQLPLVRKEIKKKTTEEVWADLFTHKIQGWDIPWSEMCYNLYLLHLRSKLLPPGVISYGPLEGKGMAYVEIPSKNKDYRTELVFSFDRGLLLSYVLVTDRTNPESDEVRARFLKGISFRASDKSIAPLIYREFKQLSFVRQTDQEGMLYLFSAWSHNLEDQEMLKEMVYFLERGPKNGPQLRPLYRYSFQRYQRTHTTRDVGLDEDEPDIRLQRQIELEGIAERSRLLEKPKEAPQEVEVTPREKMDEFLKKAREEKNKPRPKKRDKLIVH